MYNSGQTLGLAALPSQPYYTILEYRKIVWIHVFNVVCGVREKAGHVQFRNATNTNLFQDFCP